jgi:hypothetical protein
MSQWEALPRHRGGGGRSVDWPVTVAAAALLRHRWGGGRSVAWPVIVAAAPLAREGMSCIAQIRHNTLYIFMTLEGVHYSKHFC